MRILDPGPIRYGDIELSADPDLEYHLREEGLDPKQTTYRLLEIPLTAIVDAQSMPWERLRNAELEARISSGAGIPPIVVKPATSPSEAWLLLDGVNRTHASLIVGAPTIRAYELTV